MEYNFFFSLCLAIDSRDLPPTPIKESFRLVWLPFSWCAGCADWRLPVGPVRCQCFSVSMVQASPPWPPSSQQPKAQAEEGGKPMGLQLGGQGASRGTAGQVSLERHSRCHGHEQTHSSLVSSSTSVVGFSSFLLKPLSHLLFYFGLVDILSPPSSRC